MRLWSIHPKHLDTKGYRNHPQLDRFKQCSDPIKAIGFYLFSIYEEATRRGFKFDISKIHTIGVVYIPVTSGQLEYEIAHLAKKIRVRTNSELPKKTDVKLHRMFKLIEGPIESWEVTKT